MSHYLFVIKMFLSRKVFFYFIKHLIFNYILKKRVQVSAVWVLKKQKLLSNAEAELLLTVDIHVKRLLEFPLSSHRG